MGILGLGKDQIVAIRGATSALGQAAVNIAKHIGARVIATTRNSSRAAMLDALGVNEVLVESPELANRIRERHPQGIDAVLDIVGNTRCSTRSPRSSAAAMPVSSVSLAVVARCRSNRYFRSRAPGT
jgi:NADPH:quinone reductase-like Zn-dependent oxidoreductase